MDAILLMGHGTRDSDGADGFLSLAGAVRARADGRTVEAGVLEFPGPRLPSLQEAIDRCVRAGAERIAAVPLLLHDAGHNQDDMPLEIARARKRFPHVDIGLAPPLGLNLALLEATEDRIRETDARLGPADSGETAVLLVGRGTTTPLANADFFKAGRLIWERMSYGFVECCFASLTGPGVPAGIERCARLGARRILVIPYFLHTGVLVKRIERQSAEAHAACPETEIAMGEPLGTHPHVAQLILDRARELLGDRTASPTAAAS